MHQSENLLTFLEQAGQGCISGKIIEWPQLKPACKWAAEEIERLRYEIVSLIEAKTQYRLALGSLQQALNGLETKTNCTHTLIITPQSVELAIAPIRGNSAVIKRLDKGINNEHQ